MSSVMVYTQAYNAEKTVARTIESVLSQTHRDFAYHIVDNGSLDSTGAIIKSFSGRDGRIIAVANAANGKWEPGNFFPDVLARCDPGSFFCMVDADDEYKPDFLEKMLAFIEKNRLDFAVCGNDFVSSDNGSLLSVRALEHDLILEGESFGTQFPLYHQFTRTYWGKLFPVPLLRDSVVNAYNYHSYGTDTLLAQGAFRRATRVGILAGSLHKYYLNTQSASYHFDAKRVRGDRVLFDAAKDFLMAKAGSISPQNEHFLYGVYLNAIRDTLRVLAAAQIPDSEKMEHVGYIKAEMDEIQRYFDTVHPRPPIP